MHILDLQLNSLISLRFKCIWVTHHLFLCFSSAFPELYEIYLYSQFGPIVQINSIANFHIHLDNKKYWSNPVINSMTKVFTQLENYGRRIYPQIFFSHSSQVGGKKKVDLRTIIVICTVEEHEQWLSASLKFFKIYWVIDFFNCEKSINHSIEHIFYHESSFNSSMIMWSFISGSLKIIMS